MRWLVKCLFAGTVAVCSALLAFALDPNRTLSQYIKTVWGPENGFVAGPVSSISQTQDGYLWIGTAKGLVRFDGVNFRKFDQASPLSLPIGPVQKLLADNAGNLWVLLRTTKLLHYHDGKFDVSHPEVENGITAVGLGQTGAIIASSDALGTLTYSANHFGTVSPALVFPDSRAAAADIPDDRSTRLSWSTGLTPHRLASPNTSVTSMAASADGKTWLGTEDRGLFYLSEGKIYPAKGVPVARVTCLLPLERSQIWIGTNKGVVIWNGRELTRSDVPAPLLNVNVFSMLRDRDSNIWVGTDRGLVRLNPRDPASFVTSIPSSDAPITALFEDREGNIWAGGAHGLERFRDSTFVAYLAQGRSSQSLGPLYVDSSDHIWFAPTDGGLRQLRGSAAVPVQVAGLSQDIVYSISGRDNDLWLARRRGGLTHLRYLKGSFLANSYTHSDGLAQDSVYSVYVSRDGTVWAGTLSGGVSAFRNGLFTTFTTADGLASDTVSTIAEDSDRTMWFGTPSGLTAMSKVGWRTYSDRDGLPSSDVNCLLRDSTGVLWVGTAVGLSFLTHDHVEVPRDLPDSLREPIFGIAEDRNNSLWIATANRILQVKRSALVANALAATDVREYGLDDGLSGTEGVKRYQSVVADSQGRVWFSTNRGLSMANPVRATATSAPAFVHIEGVAADGTAFALASPIRFPPGTRRMTFRYVGLSLSNPDRVRYRYRLDGFDRDWSEAGANREATYNNLAPGTYRFRVVASNSDGLWNGSEAAVAFAVEPTLWQTSWFQSLGVVCAGLLAFLAYRLRMHQLTQLLKVAFEERIAERTRIARELHDTLLQSFQGLMMKLYALTLLLDRPNEARDVLDGLLQQGQQAIDAGRDAVRGMRSSAVIQNDLAAALVMIGESFAADHKQANPVDFRVVVEGPSRNLHPILRDEVYRIASEATFNAFRHSGAEWIEVEICYEKKHLRVRVRDNGKGIDPHVLDGGGRDGHYGLPGMKERAKLVGGKLSLWSKLNAGTEVELTIPASVAYSKPSAPSPSTS